MRSVREGRRSVGEAGREGLCSIWVTVKTQTRPGLSVQAGPASPEIDEKIGKGEASMYTESYRAGFDEGRHQVTVP